MIALTVFWILTEAERAFRRGEHNPVERDIGWRLLEQAEQRLPLIESDELFEQAQNHSNRVWAIASPELPISRVAGIKALKSEDGAGV